MCNSIYINIINKKKACQGDFSIGPTTQGNGVMVETNTPCPHRYIIKYHLFQTSKEMYAITATTSSLANPIQCPLHVILLTKKDKASMAKADG